VKRQRQVQLLTRLSGGALVRRGMRMRALRPSLILVRRAATMTLEYRQAQAQFT